MKILFLKLNEVLDKSNNLYLRFLISFIIILMPFLCASSLIFIAIHNYSRAIILSLLLLVSFFERTRDNKSILAFIGLIPLGFYVVTSPVVLGWHLSFVAKDIGGVMLSNPITTIISGVSIFGIIKAAKSASSIYEWFLNTGFGGYFFPEYKNLKQELTLKNQTILDLIKSNQESIQRETKTANELAKSTTLLTQIQRLLKEVIEHPIIQRTKEHFRLSDNHAKHYFITIPANPQVKPIAELHNDMLDVFDLSKEQIIDNKKQIKEHFETTKQASNQLTQIQQSNSGTTIVVSEAILNLTQKLMTGSLTILGLEAIHQIINSDTTYLIKGYNLFSNYMRPSFALGITTISTFVSVIGIGETVNSLLIVGNNTYQGAKNLIEKGIKNITDKITSGEVPNTNQEQKGKVKDIHQIVTDTLAITATSLEEVKARKTARLLKEIPLVPNSSFVKEGIQDVSLVRKSGYRDFIETKSIPKPTRIPTIKPQLSTTLNDEKIKSITWSLPD